MSHDIGQWINEIQTLRQQLVEAQRDRDAAVESASKWRQLYNTEAQQRRNQAQVARETVEQLEAQIQQLQNVSSVTGDEEAIALELEIEQIQAPQELKAKAIEAIRERDRFEEEVQNLKEALEREQTSHAQTRQTLTTALGDAVDLLKSAKIVADGQPATIPQGQINPTVIAELPESDRKALAQLPQWQEKESK